MSEVVVLDASALLCLLNDERGAARVSEVLNRAVICAVNLAEVVAKLADGGGTPAQIERVLRALQLRVAPFDDELAMATGLLRPATRQHGLSLGDRACLALAARLSAPAMTADRAWGALTPQVAVTIEVIR